MRRRRVLGTSEQHLSLAAARSGAMRTKETLEDTSDANDANKFALTIVKLLHCGRPRILKLSNPGNVLNCSDTQVFTSFCWTVPRHHLPRGWQRARWPHGVSSTLLRTRAFVCRFKERKHCAAKTHARVWREGKFEHELVKVPLACACEILHHPPKPSRTSSGKHRRAAQSGWSCLQR